MYLCQPLREAVSWNFHICLFVFRDFKSASSWGCELKCYSQCMDPDYQRQPLREAVSWNDSGIRHKSDSYCQPLREAVSWNNNLIHASCRQSGQPLREAVSWNTPADVMIVDYDVSLFVRLWVEMRSQQKSPDRLCCQPLREAVSWNIRCSTAELHSISQPLREAVSWNILRKIICKLLFCQPLREAVSWNNSASTSFPL